MKKYLTIVVELDQAAPYPDEPPVLREGAITVLGSGLTRDEFAYLGEHWAQSDSFQTETVPAMIERVYGASKAAPNPQLTVALAMEAMGVDAWLLRDWLDSRHRPSVRSVLEEFRSEEQAALRLEELARA